MANRLLILLMLAVCSATIQADNDPHTLSAQSREIIKTFSKRLQNELQQAMANGGPVNAIDVCKVKAPAIAAALSTDGWIVRRTSLQVRNPLNAPDDFERKFLQDFADKKASGWAIENLAYYKMREYGDASEFRYMKAIPTKAVCLTCHGQDIPADVRQKLNSAYPDDQARGYQAGDIRGAFSLRKRLASENPDRENAPARLEDYQAGALPPTITRAP